MKKRILFITGTRADFGKQKALMKVVDEHDNFDLSIFCTGMHLMSKYGYTVEEIKKAGFSNRLFYYLNQIEGESMEIILSNTIAGLSRYLHENEVDLIIIHGDRIEALAGATVGALRNILVAHIEGGEISGTIDDLIRHSTSKMAHIHFVASKTAFKRLIQLGENKNNIYNIGSPDVDVMLSGELPNLEEAKSRYEIDFDDYAIAILHPVTTEVEIMKENASKFIDALEKSQQNYIVIYPNNDLGSEYIFKAIKTVKCNKRIKVFPSLRFEYFLTLLKHSKFIIGNSSAGIHEAPVYGIPTIDIGTRQSKRFIYESIHNIDFEEENILKTIEYVIDKKRFTPTQHYGKGNSAKLFMQAIDDSLLWEVKKQKKFIDIN
jgi:UDP-N-acetylglucosamine 2-epimerase (hydrolysing)